MHAPYSFRVTEGQPTVLYPVRSSSGRFLPFHTHFNTTSLMHASSTLSRCRSPSIHRSMFRAIALTATSGRSEYSSPLSPSTPGALPVLSRRKIVATNVFAFFLLYSESVNSRFKFTMLFFSLRPGYRSSLEMSASFGASSFGLSSF